MGKRIWQHGKKPYEVGKTGSGVTASSTPPAKETETKPQETKKES